ncbi:MAG: molybdopterin-guanine dinucleotide biosynthesis protein MobB [Rhodospirillaceae bacterium]|nr:molybdopterin-guanine dinucleotide biosynthesis protein MobB [Rhodospirillaceae bacterium]
MATQLIETLCGRGRRVAVIAAGPGPLAIDEPGKDSYEHAAAGARDVVVVSGRRWARVHRSDPPAPPRAAALAALAKDADVVLALGFDDHAAPRLTVEPGADGEPGPALKVLAEDGRRPAFRLDKPEAIADLIERLSEEAS